MTPRSWGPNTPGSRSSRRGEPVQPDPRHPLGTGEVRVPDVELRHRDPVRARGRDPAQQRLVADEPDDPWHAALLGDARADQREAHSEGEQAEIAGEPRVQMVEAQPQRGYPLVPRERHHAHGDEPDCLDEHDPSNTTRDPADGPRVQRQEEIEGELHAQRPGLLDPAVAVVPRVLLEQPVVGDEVTDIVDLMLGSGLMEDVDGERRARASTPGRCGGSAPGSSAREASARGR